LIHSTDAAGVNSDSEEQWEGRLDKLQVAAHELGYERALRTNLDLPRYVTTFEEHPLTEEEMKLWSRNRNIGYKAGIYRKQAEKIAETKHRRNEGKKLTAKDREWLAVDQKERDREKKRIRKRIRYRVAGESSKPSVKQQRKQGSRKGLRSQRQEGKLKS
jgi:hypothetical protein